MGSDNLQSKYKQFERLYIYFSYKIFINKLFIWMIPTDSKLYYLIRKILLHRVCRHMLALCYCALDLATIPSGSMNRSSLEFDVLRLWGVSLMANLIWPKFDTKFKNCRKTNLLPIFFTTSVSMLLGLWQFSKFGNVEFVDKAQWMRMVVILYLTKGVSISK